jgi:hypothetical protein
MRTSILSAILLASTAVAAAPTPVGRYDAGGGGFIDDAFALRDDGKAVAYITTDGATTATLHLVDVGGNDVKIAGAPTDAIAIHWLSPTRVLIVRGGEAGAATSTAQLFTAAGAQKQKLGPFGQLARATVDGKPAIVTYTRSEKHGVDHALVAYATDTLRPLRRRTWHEDAEGQIKQGPSSIKPLWWANGFTELAALRAGEYDKARDIRRPDRYTRLDVLTGKVIDESEVQDVLGFTQVSLLRRNAPNQTVIARYSDDHKKLLFVDGLAQYDVTLARDLWKYEPQTLAWQTLDDHTVALSLTVDPVNPDAVNRKKADVDEFDLYEVDRQSHAARRLLVLNGEGRRSSWQLYGHRLLLLRKGKGFDRGGVALEVYDLGDATQARKP